MSEQYEVQNNKYIASALARSEEREWVSPLGVKDSFEYLLNLPERHHDDSPLLIGDIGCGTGELTAALSKSYPNADIFGIDLSYEAASVADQRYGDAENTTFIGGNAENILPYFEEFDIIYSINMVQNTPNPPQTVSYLRDSLTPGGQLVLTAPGNEGQQMFPDYAGYDKTLDLPYLEAKNVEIDGETVDWKQYLLPEERIERLFDRLDLHLIEAETIPANPAGVSSIIDILGADIMNHSQNDQNDIDIPVPTVNAYKLEK